MHHPVTTHEGEHVDAIVDCTPSHRLRLRKVPTQQDLKVRAAVAQPACDVWQHFQSATFASRGIDYQPDLPRHLGGSGSSSERSLSSRSALSSVTVCRTIRSSPASATWRSLRRSRMCAITSAPRNSSAIGAATASMENGSVDGVATAPNTKVPKITRLRYFAICLALMTPTMFNISTISGIRKPIPKTSIRRSKKDR